MLKSDGGVFLECRLCLCVESLIKVHKKFNSSSFFLDLQCVPDTNLWSTSRTFF